MGPLHGVPVSLKDQFHVKNVGTSMGYVGWLVDGTFEGKETSEKAGTFESEIVKELRSLGAVLYVKTSVPHTLMSGVTNNHIVGLCLNPKNRLLSAGGSSGGEGALIACKGSPIGIGSDIGGSVRIPAAFNGLYGLRPTNGRLPYEGVANSMDGQNSVPSVLGPLAGSARDLRLITRALISTEPWRHDPLVVEIPWRQSAEQAVQNKTAKSSSTKLTFGVIRHDGIVTPHPPVSRAVENIVAALEEQGHQVVAWSPPSDLHKRLIDLCGRVWSWDGGADCISAFELSGEEPIPQIGLMFPKTPGKQANASEIMAVNVALRAAKKEYLNYWESTASITSSGERVDAVICPVAPFAAAQPNEYNYYGYSSWVNTVDYTSVVVPVTTVQPEVDGVNASFEAIDARDANTQAAYDPKVYVGAPVAVQLVGRRFEEEKMVAIAEYVASVLPRSSRS
ncbi:hypothetical protein MRB53_040564 [Persea americana]|nr:hypothetical protein MRB53_040564 [Persea americana]